MVLLGLESTAKRTPVLPLAGKQGKDRVTQGHVPYRYIALHSKLKLPPKLAYSWY